MKAKGVRICRIGDVDVIVDYSWIVIFFLLAYSMAETVFPEMYKDHERPVYWLMGISASVLAFVSILIHELAHSWVSIKRGIKITSVRLFIFGGTAEAASEPKDGRDEFLIALVGPAANVLMCVLSGFVFISMMEHTNHPVTIIAQWAIVTNIVIAFFNLAPGFPLDGGRVLRAFLWDHWNDMARATRVVSRVGDVIAVFLIVFGALQMIFYQSLLSGIWLICIGFLMKRASSGALQAVAAAPKREPPPRVLARELMKKNVVGVDWLVPVNQFVEDYMRRYLFTEFPVFNRDEIVGVVTLADVSGVAEKLRDFKQVRDIMTPIEQFAAPRPDDDVDSVFEKMLEIDADSMLILEEGGRLAGILLRRDIANYTQIKMILKQ